MRTEQENMSKRKVAGHLLGFGAVLGVAIGASQCLDDDVKKDITNSSAPILPAPFVPLDLTEQDCEFDEPKWVYVGIPSPKINPETGASSPICIEYPLGSLQPVLPKDHIVYYGSGYMGPYGDQAPE